MKYVPLLFVLLLAGCAASTEALIEKAEDCVANHISPTGVMGKPTDEDRTDCWFDVNARMEAEERRKAKQISSTCPTGSVMWCRVYSKHDKRCSCVGRHGPF